ncbi:MAG: adenylosuccinate synthetase, partial [Anaerovoracaceae bacterium]
MLTSVTGINWGDEGKGRIVDLLCEKADYCVRYQGGNNAGHTVVTDDGEFVMNLLPSGILHPDTVCVLGGGMVVDPDHLRHEISMMQYMKVDISPENLKISDKATICMPFHVRQDVLEEDRLSKSGSEYGSTRKGIAYSYGDKYMKKTLRMGDLLMIDTYEFRRRLEVIVES